MKKVLVDGQTPSHQSGSRDLHASVEAKNASHDGGRVVGVNYRVAEDCGSVEILSILTEDSKDAQRASATTVRAAQGSILRRAFKRIGLIFASLALLCAAAFGATFLSGDASGSVMSLSGDELIFALGSVTCVILAPATAWALRRWFFPVRVPRHVSPIAVVLSEENRQKTIHRAPSLIDVVYSSHAITQRFLSEYRKRVVNSAAVTAAASAAIFTTLAFGIYLMSTGEEGEATLSAFAVIIGFMAQLFGWVIFAVECHGKTEVRSVLTDVATFVPAADVPSTSDMDITERTKK